MRNMDSHSNWEESLLSCPSEYHQNVYHLLFVSLESAFILKYLNTSNVGKK